MTNCHDSAAARDGRLTLAERVRREHVRWLREAWRHPERVPRIPTRRVDEGGFSALMRLPQGRAWARAWWESAFAAVDVEW